MSYLLYCLFQHSEELEIEELSGGVEGQPIVVLAHSGLMAVVSVFSAPELPQGDMDTIMTYRRVIDFFHRKRTIIPMRYGSVFPGERQVVRFLEEHSEEYCALLEALDGCVEMGIRVLPNSSGSQETAVEPPSPNRAARISGVAGTGKGYLSARRRHYADRDQFAEAEKAVIEMVRRPFSGHFVRCKVEKSMPIMGNQGSSGRMLSLYFLVRRKDMEEFRRIFQDFTARCSEKMLLSGPWPPFNFVVPSVS